MSVAAPLRDYWLRHRAEPLAAFRILVGLTVLAALLTGTFPYLPLVCGEDGLVPVDGNDEILKRHGRISLLRGPDGIPLLGEWLPKELAVRDPDDRGREADGGNRTRLSRWLENWVSPEGKKAWAASGARTSSHYLLAGLYVVVLLGLIVGFRPRLMALCAALLASTFYHRFWEMTNGGDSLFRNALYFLVLAPSGAAWSVDRWLRTRPGSIHNRLRGWMGLPPRTPDEPALVPWWWVPWVWLAQLQLCVMYFFTGYAKLDSDYLTGEALYWVMNDLEITRWSYAALPLPLFVCKLMTWATLLFEMGFVFLVWLGPRPRWLLVGGFALHAVALLLLKDSLGVEVARADRYLLVAAGGLIGLLLWLRWPGGSWSAPAESPSTVAAGRAVLLAFVVLHEALLLFLAGRSPGARALFGWLRPSGPADYLLIAAVVGFVAGCVRERLRWLLVPADALHAVAFFLGRGSDIGDVGFWEAYVVAAAFGLLGMLAWLAVLDRRLWGPAEVKTPAEAGHWVLLVLVAQHVGLMLYLTASTLLIPAPHLAMAFMLSLLMWCGPSGRWVLLAGVGLHLGIMLTMEIGWFSQVTLCFYLLFVPGDKLSQAVRAAASWLRGPAARPVAAPQVEEAQVMSAPR